MKIVSDLSVTAQRTSHASLPWDTYWRSPLTNTHPALVLDFAAGAYGAGGTAHPLSSVMTFARSSPASYVAANGLLATAQPDVPRFEHDPNSLAPVGLLIEGAATNLVLNSDAPVDQTFVVANQQYVFSFYGSGVVSFSGAHTGSVTGGGAYPERSELAFIPAAGNLTISFSGDVVAPQLELGSVASSYISTGAAAATRDGESASVGIGPWFSNSAGTLVYSGTVEAAQANDRLVEIDAGDTATRISILWNTTLSKPQFQAWNAGALQAAIAPGGDAIPTGSNFRVAVAFAQDDFAMSLDGTPCTSDNLGIIPAALTTLRLGRSIWGAQGQTRIESLVYYDTRLSNAELEALSS